MTTRLFVGLLLAALVATGTTLTAAQDHWTDDDVRIRVREVIREVAYEVREALREVRRETRHVARDVGRTVAREIRQATRDLDRDHRDYDADARRRRDEARARAREVRGGERDRARDTRERERDTRAFAQVSPTDDPCSRESRGSRGHACEVRDTRLPAPGGTLTVDASPNGGIRVEGWDQADVLVRAVVQTWADNDADARALLPEVHVTAAGTTVSADGPRRGDGSGRRERGWLVSYRIWAPRQTAVALTALNGGVSLHGMRGASRFTTQNGGVTLDDMAGDVSGRTQNGGVNVRLAGERWSGAGLDVETTNGGVSLALPKGYSAALDVSTVNGGFRTDVPMTVQGRIDRRVQATLGSGGPLVRVRTTNGGVKIAER
jgi:Putative adhesin